MRIRNRCELYFDNDQFTLDDATRACGKRKLSVTRPAGECPSIVQWDGGPRPARPPSPAARPFGDDARRLGAGTRHADRLARCGSRLEITFADLDDCAWTRSTR